MKTNKTLATAVALALSAWSLTAQENPPQNPARAPGAPERPPGQQRQSAQQREGEPRRDVQRPMPGLFNALDTNHDGVIDAAELGKAADVLRRLDRNGDGRITPDEMSAIGVQPREGEARRPQIREGEAARPGQPDGNGNRAARPDGARRENQPGAPALGQSRAPEQGRGLDQRRQQPNPQIAQLRENRGPVQPDRGARQQPGFGQRGNFQPPNFTQRAPGPDAPRNPGPQGNPQFGRSPGQQHDPFAFGHSQRGNPPQGQPGAPNQGRGFDLGGHQPGPQFAQRHERRMSAFAQRGGPQQPGDPRHHRMAQNDRSPGHAGARPPRHDGPQVRNFNGPRTPQIAPQFGGMNRPFGMMGRQRGPGPQPGAQPPGPGGPQPQQGFHGPPNPQQGSPHPMGSNPPGPQGRDGHRRHHEHGPQHPPQPEGGRPPGPPQF